ncbi:MAG: hypothetical protein JRI55_09835 [Deltaproteobacteria bacterium]|jgi:hypothetical protein|nr:hypothetical protein [Deltaproteobacteria bacterium]
MVPTIEAAAPPRKSSPLPTLVASLADLLQPEAAPTPRATGSDPLMDEIVRLRRQLWRTRLVAALTSVTSMLALIVVAATGSPEPVEPASRLSAGHWASHVKHALHVLPKAAVDGSRPLAGAKVDLKISSITRDTVISLVPERGLARVISGPFPKVLELAPGVYSVQAYKPGFAPFKRELALGLDRPKRELVVHFRGRARPYAMAEGRRRVHHRLAPTRL